MEKQQRSSNPINKYKYYPILLLPCVGHIMGFWHYDCVCVFVCVIISSLLVGFPVCVVRVAPVLMQLLIVVFICVLTGALSD